MKALRKDNLYVPNQIMSLEELTGLPVAKGMEKAIVSNGKIVNVVSNRYGHLPNEDFFGLAEQKMKATGLDYDIETVNREDKSFKMNFILKADKYRFNIKNDADSVNAMLTFYSSYDSTVRSAGNLSIYRQVCSNGLHMWKSLDEFKFKHTGNIVSVIMPELEGIIEQFTNNEFFEIKRVFEVLAEKPITDLTGFVKYVLGETGLFKYEASEKNPEPSLNARLVMDTIRNEANQLGTTPNLWLGYNAFNELLHGKLKKSFETQRSLDGQLFDTISHMAN